MTEPPNRRDLELAAHHLSQEANALKIEADGNEQYLADAQSLEKVAELCKQLVPALEQFGPMMEAFVRSQG